MIFLTHIGRVQFFCVNESTDFSNKYIFLRKQVTEKMMKMYTSFFRGINTYTQFFILEFTTRYRLKQIKYFVCPVVSGFGIIDLTAKYSISPVFCICRDKINYPENHAIGKRIPVYLWICGSFFFIQI